MRIALIILVVFSLAPFAHAADDAAIKQAYITYLQARIDHNLDAAKAASTGDELGQRYLAQDIERQTLAEKLKVAQMKFRHPGVATSQPVMKAETTFKMMLDNATITQDGDTAKITPKGAPISYCFRKVDGSWKADLNHWGSAITAEQVAQYEKTLPLMRDIIGKIDSGEIKSEADLESAMKNAQRAAGQPATGPAAKIGR